VLDGLSNKPLGPVADGMSEDSIRRLDARITRVKLHQTLPTPRTAQAEIEDAHSDS
jgi:hypothetical protein